MLWAQAFRKQNAIPALRFDAGFYSILLGILFSGITEILQGFIFIQRSADLNDYLANTAGVLCGWWFFKLFVQKQNA
jgi:VanZ family protein